MKISKYELNECKKLGISPKEYERQIKLTLNRGKGIQDFNKFNKREKERNTKMLNNLLNKN